MPDRSSPETVATRRATVQDTAAIALLFDAYRQFYAQAADLPLATRFIHDRLHHNESVVIVAEGAGGEVLGFCQLYPSFCSVAAAPICVLYDLFVRPEGRRTGAGRALMRAAKAHAAAHGFTRLDLTTAKTNLSAQSLYKSLGWVRDEVFHAYSKALPDEAR